MRIGVNTLFLIPTEVGGSETYLRNALQHLARGPADLEFVVFTNNENDETLRQWLDGCGNVEYERLAFNARNRYMRIIREQTELPRRAARAAVDILWSAGYTAPFRCGCPQVVSIYDMQYRAFPADFGLVSRFVTHLLVRSASVRCERIIALSEFSKREIVKYTAASPGKICVVYGGVDSGFGVPGEPGERRDRTRRLVGADTPYLLCVANSYPHKNLPLLLQAFGAVSSEIPHRLVIVGRPGLGEPRVQAALAAMPDSVRVLRLPYVSEQDLIVLYQGAALFVFPSLYEGFGLPVLEAMMARVPVLTTRCAAIPESGGDCVEYFDPAKPDEPARKILAMLSMSSEARARWIERAAERASRFTWSETARGMAACFAEPAIRNRSSDG